MLRRRSARHGCPVRLQQPSCMRSRVPLLFGRLHIARQLSVVTETMAPKHVKKAHYSCHLQVINVDNSTAAPSVLLVLDNRRYLFNAGEGIQRHFIEYKQKMRQVGSSSSSRSAGACSQAAKLQPFTVQNWQR
eukprot:GHRQ01033022.1.p1 GENE.GHRQ01033022.1~~GHRQ01033022.1.p1  ORF type:complete len:142 (+),score=29.73 GHRQ01033022.1:29-427(+)